MDKINRVSLFLILTFSISFSLVGLYKVFGGQYGNQNEGTILAIVYMFIPSVCAIIVQKVIHKEPLTNLFISFKINKWFFIAWLVTPLISFGAMGISLLFPEVSYSPEMTGMVERFENMLSPEQMDQMKKSMETLPIHPIWLALLQGLIAGVTINAVAGFGEELGWRGFLLKAFKEMNFLKASVIIGFIWGIWHSPLILLGHNYPQHPEIGVLMMTVWCILLTPLFLYLTIKSKSVIAAAIMHGTLNGTGGIAVMVIDGGNDLTVGMSGLAGFLSLMVVLTAFFVYDSKVSNEKIMTNKIRNYL